MTRASTEQNYYYFLAGEMLHYVSLLLNICLTSAAMLAWPSPSAYDSWWKPHGFCVLEKEKETTTTMIPTEILCCLLLTSSAVMSYLVTSNKSSLFPTLEANPHLAARIKSGIFANAAHGIGHLVIWLLEEPAPPLELSLKPAAIANLLSLVAFWVGVLGNVVESFTTVQAFQMAIVVLTAQNFVLHVPPELAFTYSQAVILLAGSLDQLIKLKKSQYTTTTTTTTTTTNRENDGFLYLAIAVSYLPLYLFFYMEMTSCSQGLVKLLGGHALYDLYLSLLPFGLYAAVQMHGTSTTKAKTT